MLANVLKSSPSLRISFQVTPAFVRYPCEVSACSAAFSASQGKFKAALQTIVVHCMAVPLSPDNQGRLWVFLSLLGWARGGCNEGKTGQTVKNTKRQLRAIQDSL
eukprot:2159498-Amphidinium_carterae.1